MSACILAIPSMPQSTLPAIGQVAGNPNLGYGGSGSRSLEMYFTMFLSCPTRLPRLFRRPAPADIYTILLG